MRGHSLADGRRRAALVDRRLRVSGGADAAGADLSRPHGQLRVRLALPSFDVGCRGVIDTAEFGRFCQTRGTQRTLNASKVRLSTACRFVQSDDQAVADLLATVLDYDAIIRLFEAFRARAVSFSTDRAYLESIITAITYFKLNRRRLALSESIAEQLREAEDAYRFLLTRVRRAYKLEPKLGSDLDHLRAIGCWLEDPRDLKRIMADSDTDHARLWRLVDRRGAVTSAEFVQLRQHLVVRLYVYGKVARPHEWAGLCFSDLSLPTTVRRDGVAFVVARAGKTEMSYGKQALPLNAEMRRLLKRHELELMPLLAKALGRPVHARRGDGSVVDRVFVSTGTTTARVDDVPTFVSKDFSSFFVRFAGKHITTNLLASCFRTWATRSCSAREIAWLDYSRTHSGDVAEQNYLKVSAIEAAEQSFHICNSLIMSDSNVGEGRRVRGGDGRRVGDARDERDEAAADAADALAIAAVDHRRRQRAGHVTPPPSGERRGVKNDDDTSSDTSSDDAAAGPDPAYFPPLPAEDERVNGRSYIVAGRVREFRRGADGRGRLYCVLHGKRADNCESRHCVSGTPRRRKRQKR